MGNMLAFLGRDMAVDLGTANTLVYVRGRGIALNEPSVALNTNTGVQAKRMIGRTPGTIVAIRPLKDGVIADFEVTERMLRYFIQQVHRRRHLAKPRLVVAVPSGITGVEQSALSPSSGSAVPARTPARGRSRLRRSNGGSRAWPATAAGSISWASPSGPEAALATAALAARVDGVVAFAPSDVAQPLTQPDARPPTVPLTVLRFGFEPEHTSLRPGG
jgi:hypothetical protein